MYTDEVKLTRKLRQYTYTILSQYIDSYSIEISMAKAFHFEASPYYSVVYLCVMTQTKFCQRCYFSSSFPLSLFFHSIFSYILPDRSINIWFYYNFHTNGYRIDWRTQQNPIPISPTHTKTGSSTIDFVVFLCGKKVARNPLYTEWFLRI